MTIVCIAVGVAVPIAKGNHHPIAIALIGLAVGSGLAAILRKPAPASSSRLLICVLAVGLLLQAGLLIAWPLIPVGGEINADALTVTGIGMAGVAVGAALCVAAALLPRIHALVLPLGVGIMLVFHIIAGISSVEAARSPPMDVIGFQQMASGELLSGGNPYSMRFPDPSFGTSTHYGAGLQADGSLLTGFPYPPLSLLLTTPLTILTEEFRYTHALAVTLTGALIAFVIPLRRSPIPALAAALFLLTPSGPFVIANGWTEPLVALFLAITVFVAVRKPRWLGPPLGLFWAIKQHVPLTAPLALLLPLTDRSGGNGSDFRRTGIAIATAAVVSLPLALWDVGSFLNSTISFQFRQPFRPDALSFLSSWYHATGVVLPSWIAFLALAAIQALSLWRLRRGAGSYAVAITVSLLVFFALSKQAFANYYFFVIAASAIAVAAMSHGEESSPASGQRKAEVR